MKLNCFYWRHHSCIQKYEFKFRMQVSYYQVHSICAHFTKEKNTLATLHVLSENIFIFLQNQQHFIDGLFFFPTLPKMHIINITWTLCFFPDCLSNCQETNHTWCLIYCYPWYSIAQKKKRNAILMEKWGELLVHNINRNFMSV